MAAAAEDIAAAQSEQQQPAARPSPMYRYTERVAQLEKQVSKAEQHRIKNHERKYRRKSVPNQSTPSQRSRSGERVDAARNAWRQMKAAPNPASEQSQMAVPTRGMLLRGYPESDQYSSTSLTSSLNLSSSGNRSIPMELSPTDLSSQSRSPHASNRSSVSPPARQQENSHWVRMPKPLDKDEAKRQRMQQERLLMSPDPLDKY